MVVGPANPPATSEEINEEAKKIQNRTFKGFGVLALFVGLLGFIPSYYKAVTVGALWSVSHNALHTENAYLIPHTICMALWLFPGFLQLWTGGVPRYRMIHRIAGYLALSGLAIGMLGAAANIATYVSDPGSFMTTFYTSVLIAGATVNGAWGLLRARQRRFKEHKDHMMMTFMWTLDPAVQRLAMWLIRWFFPGYLNPDQLLFFGKLPANIFLVTCFGWMLVSGRRVTCVTVTNVSGQLCLFFLMCGIEFANLPIVPRHIFVLTVILLCAVVLEVGVLALVWRTVLGASSTNPQHTRPPLDQALTAP